MSPWRNIKGGRMKCRPARRGETPFEERYESGELDLFIPHAPTKNATTVEKTSKLRRSLRQEKRTSARAEHDWRKQNYKGSKVSDYCINAKIKGWHYHKSFDMASPVDKRRVFIFDPGQGIVLLDLEKTIQQLSGESKGKQQSIEWENNFDNLDNQVVLALMGENIEEGRHYLHNLIEGPHAGYKLRGQPNEDK